MTESLSTNDRIDRIESRLAIGQLPIRYAMDHATGAVYCRAEHEVEDRWIVMAICYFDDYRRVDDEWLFARRREKHWYAADINEHPQAVGFDSWHGDDPPRLPGEFATRAGFWASIETASAHDGLEPFDERGV